MLPIVGQIFTAVRPDMPRAPFARCGAVGVIPGGFMIWALHTEICRWPLSSCITCCSVGKLAVSHVA